MPEWSSGYVADVGYTYGYYQELNPLRTALLSLHAGIAPSEITTACELGFGQGLSLNIHAAASDVDWSGTDFNPSHAAFARKLAELSGSGARLFDDAFADFARRDDIPDFDYIALHGIWSWISDENRAVIVDFVKRKLKVGGILYISYNTMPGWGAFAPLRHLMTEHAATMGSAGGGIVNRINGALEFAEKLMALNPLYSRANPQVAERLKKMKEHNRHYLAHEYFNRDWHPMHFATMAGWLEDAKLQYLCSANYLDHIDALNLTEEQQRFLRETHDPLFRETVRDFIVNQQFRKDYWVKGGWKPDTSEQSAAVRSLRVVLTTPRADVSLKVTGSLGEASMNEAVYAPILDLIGDQRIRTLGEIEEGVRESGINFSQVIQAALLLTGAGHLAAAQDDEAIARARKKSEKLNIYLCKKARGSNDINYLASPVTGGGVQVNRFQQLFLLAIAEGRKQPDEWGESAWQTISAQGQKLLKDGKPLETAEDNLAELNRQAGEFAAKNLPIMKALQIV